MARGASIAVRTRRPRREGTAHAPKQENTREHRRHELAVYARDVTRNEKLALAALGLLFAWLEIDSGSAHGASSGATGQVPRGDGTAPRTRREWIATRLDAARNALRGIVPERVRESFARNIVAHWMREVGPTDDGRPARPSHYTREFRYNVGNLTAGRNYPGQWFALTTSGVIRRGLPGLKYRAYETLEDGVADYVHLVSRGIYSDAWVYMLEHPDDVAEWNVRVVSAGYSGHTADDIAEVRVELPANRRAVDAYVASTGM